MYQPYRTKDYYPIVELAVELYTRQHIIHQGTKGRVYTFPKDNALVHLKLLKTKCAIADIWDALVREGYSPATWDLMTYWVAQELDWSCFGLPVAEHEQFAYWICQQDNGEYLLLNTTNLQVLATSPYCDDLPEMVGLHLNNFYEL